jgi:Domain of unknown function (DUF4166)
MSEGALFKTQVGDAWHLAPPSIRRRFDSDPAPGVVIRYVGEMSVVRCSALGKVLGYLVRHTGALMPYEGHGVPVEIEVWKEQNSQTVHKRRSYRFPGRAPFIFTSRMQLESSGKLAEHVGGGLGMYVCVAVSGQALHFADGGYFVQMGRRRWHLPKCLAPGMVRLVHSDISATEFAITIDITHAWFGQLFYQEGRFRHTSEVM